MGGDHNDFTSKASCVLGWRVSFFTSCESAEAVCRDILEGQEEVRWWVAGKQRKTHLIDLLDVLLGQVGR